MYPLTVAGWTHLCNCISIYVYCVWCVWLHLLIINVYFGAMGIVCITWKRVILKSGKMRIPMTDIHCFSLIFWLSNQKWYMYILIIWNVLGTQKNIYFQCVLFKSKIYVHPLTKIDIRPSANRIWEYIAKYQSVWLIWQMVYAFS